MTGIFNAVFIRGTENLADGVSNIALCVILQRLLRCPSMTSRLNPVSSGTALKNGKHNFHYGQIMDGFDEN